MFQDRCARCHAADAAGSADSPDQRESQQQMGPRRFVDVVLRRYDWNLPAASAGSESAARQALIDQVLARGEAALQMPAWGEEPEVQAHVMDLYAYLAARAEGSLGPGRPARR